MKRELCLVALVTACGGSPAVPEQPPPRPTPAPDVPEPQPSPTNEDASAPEEAVAEERDGDPKGDPLARSPNDSDRWRAEHNPPNGGPGKLDPLIIHRIVRPYLGKVRRCWYQARQTDPDWEGKLRIEFTIGDTGAVTAVAVELASGIAALDQCVASVFVKMQFPPPAGGFVIVHYPFVFASG